MKVRPSITRRCKDCRLIIRNRRRYIVCKNPRHKQRQG